MKRLLSLLAFFLLTLLHVPTFAQDESIVSVDYSPTLKDLTAYVTEQMKKSNVKGLSLALVDDQEVVWTEGFGVADEKLKIPATGETLYRAGALSKIFTALEIVKLSEKRKLKLDDPLEKDLPDFDINDRFGDINEITLRGLLSHHSGLPFIYMKGMWEKDSQTLEELVDELQDDYLTASPKTLFRYSYLDYDLLGRVIELKTKISFNEAMKRELFVPLGMDATTFEMTDDIRGNLSKAYHDNKEVPEIFNRDKPMAGMITNAEDMAEFLKFLFSDGWIETDAKPKKIVSERSLASTLEDQYPGLPLDFGLKAGMGWMLTGMTVAGTERTVWQNGSYPPYTSSIVVLPEEKLGVVIFSNSPEGRKLLQDISDRALRLMLQDKAGIKSDLTEHKPVEPPVIKLTQEKLDSYTGLYSVFGQVSEITRKDDHLAGRFFDFDLDLLPIGNNLFMPEFNFLLFIHIKLPQFPLELLNIGEKTVAVVRGLPYPIPLERISAAEITPSWKECIGQYTSDDTGEQIEFQDMSLVNQKGLLTVKGKINIKPFDFKTDHFSAGLLPISNDDAVVAGLFWADGATVHAIREKGQIRLFCSGYWFTKQEPKENKK